jgi:3-deoxy-D-manno-octulosonate 8-phosphate phosphatase (KDO 8-P phosphatase)
MQSIDFKSLAKQFEKKLSPIKVFLCDVDGVLTNGQLFYSGSEMEWNRFFHASDGFGLKLLMKSGLKVGVISGGGSQGLKNRISNLGLDYGLIGNEDKNDAYRSILNDGFKPEEILYIGDELFDIPLLKKSGFSACPPHSSLEIQECVDYVTHRAAGEACVREVIDILRIVQNIVPSYPDI